MSHTTPSSPTGGEAAAAMVKAYRAQLRRTYKAKHNKKLGQSVRMMTAELFTDLYERRNPLYNGAWNAGHRPSGAWLRRRLLLIKGCVQSLGWAGLLAIPGALTPEAERGGPSRG